MSGNVQRVDDFTHRAVDAMLPWFVNETLDAHERARVVRHLRECAPCRSEVESLRELQAYYATGVAAAASAGRNRASARRIRIEWVARGFDRGAQWLDQWRRAPGWARWTIAVQCVGLAGLVLFAVLPAAESPRLYRTLGTSTRAAVPGTIAVVFGPDVPETEIRRIVRRANARIVDGPTAGNAYVLELSGGGSAETLKALRSEHGVLFAEALSPGAGR